MSEQKLAKSDESSAPWNCHPQALHFFQWKGAFLEALNELKQEKDAAGVSTYNKILGKYISSICLAQSSLD